MAQTFPQTANFTLQGTKAYNEDASLSITLTPRFHHASTPAWLTIAGVNDGHGHNGEGLDCAEFCKQRTVDWGQQLLDTETNWDSINWEEYATRFTQKMHDEYRVFCSQKNKRVINDNIVLSSFGQAVHSGSTFSMVLLYPLAVGYRLVVVQVGDSDIAVNGNVIDCDHSPLNPSEFMRVQSLDPNRRFNVFYDTPSHFKYEVFNPDGTFNPEFCNESLNGHQRWNWNKGLRPCCAKYIPGTYAKSPASFPHETSISMTRSIGDYYAHAVGLTCEPYVQVMDLQEIPTVVIASDGVWDTCDSQNKWKDAQKEHFSLEVKVESEQTLKQAVQTHCENLHKYSKSLFGKQVDDISIAVIKL